MDNSVVPDHLRPHVLPHIRRLFLDERTTPPASSNMPSEPQTQFAECSRLSAENKTLRFNCDMWRKRAECHAAATIGLLNLARTARDEALKMKKERDELQAKFQVMKRKRDVDELVLLVELLPHMLILIQSVQPILIPYDIVIGIHVLKLWIHYTRLLPS